MTKIVGLTGGIGSGKSTIAKHIQSFGIEVYYTDDEAKKMLALPNVINALTNTFGSTILEHNRISKEKLAEIVFTSPEQLKKLNAIIHPAVKSDFETWLKLNKEAPLIVKESALLFESEAYKNCDVIITVVAPLEVRVKRVMERDHTTYDQVMNRINNQWTDERRIAKSDYVIINENLDTALNQVDTIFKQLAQI